MAEAPIRVRCRQTGFRAAIPAADWAAYTDDQRAAYEQLDAPAPPLTETTDSIAKPKKG